MDKVKPVRIQRKRTKGFSLQNASPNGLPVVYVGRPTKWGNPYRVDERAAEKMQDWYACSCASVAVIQFRDDLEQGRLAVAVEDVKRELRGKNLACWCTIGDSCHADILLELTNAHG